MPPRRRRTTRRAGLSSEENSREAAGLVDLCLGGPGDVAKSATAETARFDCLKAAAPIEQLICSDPELLTPDGALGDVFAIYRYRLPEKDRAGVLAEQRAWLAQRLKQCDLPTKGGAEIPLEVRWRAARCLDEDFATSSHVG